MATDAGSTDDPLVVPPRPVGSLVSRGMVDIAPGATLRAAIARLVDGDVGVIVVRDGEEPKGIFSERDLIDAVHEQLDLDAAVVDEIMQRDIITIEPNASVVDAARLMIDVGVRHLLVTGPNPGVVSIRAVLRSMVT